MTPQRISNVFGIFLSRAKEIINGSANDDEAVLMASKEAIFRVYLPSIKAFICRHSEEKIMEMSEDCQLPDSLRIYEKYPHRKFKYNDTRFYIQLETFWYELDINESYQKVEVI